MFLDGENYQKILIVLGGAEDFDLATSPARSNNMLLCPPR
jgi:hypothetical protein